MALRRAWFALVTMTLLAAAARPSTAQTPAAPPPQPPGGAAAVPDLEGSIRELLARGGVPGVQVAVVRGGAVAWVRALGVADAASGAPVAPDTVFEAAELGVPVFAYAVERLAERGEFDLDRPLSAVVPSPDLWSDPRVKKITARRVLSHTSGLPNGRRGGALAIESEPGEKFAFSGEGVLWLQRAVEAVTGIGVDEFVRREVFSPLGMTSSGYVLPDAWRTRAAAGHDYLQRTLVARRPAGASAAASLVTTAGDYARFLVETLRPTLVRASTVERMLRAEVEVDAGISWGLGWGLERAGGRAYLWQWGNNVAFQGIAIGCRETGEGVVVLANGENGLSVAEPIVAAVLGGTHPAFAWLDVDPYDSPARTIRQRLVRSGAAGGDRGVDRALAELEKTYPRAAFSEKLLNRIGYELLGLEQAGAAVEVFSYNAKLYPKSWNVWDSLAEAYAAAGETRFAIQYYEKSLKLNPDNENAKDALRGLREAQRR